MSHELDADAHRRIAERMAMVAPKHPAEMTGQDMIAVADGLLRRDKLDPLNKQASDIIYSLVAQIVTIKAALRSSV